MRKPTASHARLVARALYEATQRGRSHIVKKFIVEGAAVDYCDQQGNTPLMAAIWEGHEDIFEMLMRAKAPIASVNKFGFTPLVLAVHYERASMVRALLTAGAAVNEVHRRRGKDGNAPKNALLAAVNRDNASLVALLLKHGADPRVEIDGAPPLLTQAVERGAKKCANALAQALATRSIAHLRDQRPRTDALDVGDWVRMPFPGYWRIYRLIAGHEQGVLAARIANEALAKSFAVRSASASLVARLSSAEAAKLRGFLSRNPNVATAFEAYRPKPIDEIYNARISIPPRKSAAAVTAAIVAHVADRPLTAASIQPLLKKLGFPELPFPQWTVQFVSRDHEQQRGRIVYRFDRILKF